MDAFLVGPLSHAPLLRVVLGRDVALTPAVLTGHAVMCLSGSDDAVAMAHPGEEALGVVARDLDAVGLARLAFHAGGGGWADAEVLLSLSGRLVRTVTLSPAPELATPSTQWDRADWLAARAAVDVVTAADVMALFGQHDAGAVMARRAAMRVRGASRLRAGGPAPATVRGTAQGVVVAARRTPYARFFSVEEYDLSFRRFDGSMSETVTRAVFISGDAVTVLPYDPVRDRVLLIEQFRPGPFARGDSQPWQLEPIAGRIDPDETPEDAARREAVEEAGLTLGALLPVAACYPTPGAKAEFLFSYVALCDLPDGVTGVFGVTGEAEDIRGHLIPFDRLMDLVASGELANGPLVLTALWLQRERAALRTAAAQA